MIGVDTIGQIRRAFHDWRKGIKTIARELGVSRATVRKVVRGDETEFKYERDVQPAPKLGAWVDDLTGLLEAESALPKRERRSTQRLFEELRGRGYEGAHDSVHRFARAWRDKRSRTPAKVYVPMSFSPGEAYQFDWSHEGITPQGLPLMVKAAHMRLSHSRMPFVRVYFRETQELVFDAHDKAFAFYGGVCRRGIYDSVHCPPSVRGRWTRRPLWRRSSWARPANTTAGFCRCARTIWSSRRHCHSDQWRDDDDPVHRPRAGRKGRSRTRLAICATRCSGPSRG
jgi:transposase